MSNFADLVHRHLDPKLSDTFGDDVEYRSRGETYTIRVILDKGDDVKQQSYAYQTAFAPLSAFTAGEPVKGDTLAYQGITYRVSHIDKLDFDGRQLRLAVIVP